MKERFKISFELSWSLFKVYLSDSDFWNKEAVLIRNAKAKVFINGYPKYFQSDNEKEFTNHTFESYLENIEVEHILWSPIILKIKV